MKCIRCGKIYDNPVDICEVCSFNFKEYANMNKYISSGPKPEDMSDNKGDLIDRPILSFAFGILGLILIGTFVFSILATTISKKPAKSSLKQVRILGIVLGYIGIIFSAVFDIILLYRFFIRILS